MKYIPLLLCLLLSLNIDAQSEQKQYDWNEFVSSYNAERMMEGKLDTLFHFFGSMYSTNTEIIEGRNEMLFGILYTGDVALFMRTLQGNVNVDFVLEEMKTPVHDGIDIKSCLLRVKAVRRNKKIKNRIMDNLTLAEKKYGN